VDSLGCGSKGGCCDSRRGLCCTHILSLEPELWLASGQARASSAQCTARAGTRLSRGRAIIPVKELSSVLSTRTRSASLSLSAA